MSRYAAFLRGMNVGGHRLTNEELRARFTAMSFTGVATFRASGNVVFTAAARAPGSAKARIEQVLAESLGYAVPTYIRSAEKVRAIAATQPFAPEHVRACTGKLHVALLTEPPSAQAREQVLELASERDRLLFGERELYWLPSGPMLESDLDLKLLERLLGAMTLRTKNTIEQICSKHLAE